MTGIGTGGIGQKLTSGGVTTPEQMALAQYHMGEGIVGSQAKFAQIPHSTNLTQAASGARFGAAKEAGQISQADAAAQQAFLNQQFGSLTSGVGGALGSIPGKVW